MAAHHSYHTGNQFTKAFASDGFIKADDQVVLDEKSELLSTIIGESAVIQKVRFLINTHAKYDAPVLVTGETGTGKELAARGLHYCGARSSKPFIAINCATLTDELFASELFGHVKGSFTDAKRDKKGLLALAEKGTLFLDEVDSLPLKSQAALLRFLQEGEYRPVGAESDYKADVRLIASANCNLEEKIRKGEFREDLYYRLYILSIHMPALHERRSDIPLLISHFIEQFDYKYSMGNKSINQKLLQYLLQREWPGNIRELENLIHRLYLCSPYDDIDETTPGIESLTSFLNNTIKMNSDSSTNSRIFNQENNIQYNDMQISEMNDNYLDKNDYNFSRDKKEAVERFEYNYVQQVMEKARGNVTLAAKMCGKERRAFGKLVKKYNIKKSSIDFDEADVVVC